MHSLLLISQDRHKLLLAFAAYTQAYKVYLKAIQSTIRMMMLIQRASFPVRTSLRNQG
jgi:hypothetical protein